MSVYIQYTRSIEHLVFFSIKNKISIFKKNKIIYFQWALVKYNKYVCFCSGFAE